jgi:hypothetical protein
MSTVLATQTARVHVLKIGARQVTLAQARRLDSVPGSCIEPFGRVRLRPTGLNWDSNFTVVIGTDRRTGELVTSDSYGYAETWAELPLISLGGA